MARTSTYLNFPGTSEEAFNFYRSVFGGEFIGGIMRFGDMPPQPGAPELPEAARKAILHIELAITGGHIIMATDAMECMGMKSAPGNNVTLNLEPDTRAEADRLFAALSAGGKVGQPMQEMFWGAYWGSFTDKFGVQWMINCVSKS